jgi:MFS family permease
MSAEFEPVAPTLVPTTPWESRTGPAEPVSRGWTARFSLVWFGYWMANLVPLQLLLPLQLAAIDPGSKVRDFAIINGVSGVVALVALPVCGALCDRSRSRFGRRRIWLAGGTLVLTVGLIMTGFQTSWEALTAWWAVSVAGLSAATAGLTAVIADRVPERQRGMISSAIYGPQALGVVVGIAAFSILGLSLLRGYVLIAVVLIACTLPFLGRYRETFSGAVHAASLRSTVTSWADSLKNREFAWAFGGRLLVNLGNSFGTCYMLYFLTDDLKVRNPDESLLVVTIVYLLAGLLATYLAGTLSDRLGRRRIFVAIAAALQALSGFLLACFPNFSVAIGASALMGGGFGAYMAVDQALVTQVLPNVQDRAKDLGIMNIGLIVPPALAPLLAGFIITSGGGYPVLFMATGVAAALGAALTYRVRSVR